MEKEKRVYVFNCEEGFDFREAERNADINDNKALIEEAERRGSVYSLQGFQEAINDEELDLSNSFILIA